MSNLPTGTVTFLFTDIEGSTKLAQGHPDKWEALRQRHHVILQSAMDGHNGHVFQIIGDAFCVAFHTAGEAIHAAVKSQKDLYYEDWGDNPVKVRMGMHTGTAQVGEDSDRSGGYTGYISMARVQRLMSAAHGGQVLISLSTAELVRDDLPGNVSLRDMGERRLKDMIRPERIYQLVIPDLPVDFPALKTLDAYRNNLPIQMTSFIGREKEMSEIKDALTEHRLVTLTGSGGAGKTRLSLQVAADSLDQFPNGVWFVELAPITDPDLIAQTILTAAGMQTQPGRSTLDSLTDFLREKTSLLVLDNCEHLIEACAKLAETLLNAAPNLKILASSREALGIKGEQTWHVPSLSIPDPKTPHPLDGLSQYEAVRLFIDRALLVQPHFSVTNENAPAVAQICYRLDGIPLAIELAAAKIRVLSVEQIAQRLDDRFRLLTGGSRSTLERHQTLHATIDWSYNLLPPAEQTLFRRLAIFVGGWTLEAAEAVCGDISAPDLVRSDDVLNLMEQLINKSIILKEEYQQGTRYHMLETIRQYAHEKLVDSGESNTIRDRHLQFFLKLAQDAEPYLHRADAVEWHDQMEGDHDNLRLALEWAQQAEHTAESGLQLANALADFWLTRGYLVEGLERISAVLAHGQAFERTTLYADVLCDAAWIASFQGDFPGARSFADNSLAIFRELGDKLGISKALHVLGAVAIDNGEYALAKNILEEALQFGRQFNDALNVNFILLLGWAEFGLGEYSRARDYLDEGLTVALMAENKGWIATALAGLAEVDLRQGRYESASKSIERSLALRKEFGDKWQIGVAFGIWAWIAVLQRDWDSAIWRLGESISVRKEIGDQGGLVWCLEKMGQVAYGKNESEKAVIIFGAAATIREEMNSQPLPFDLSQFKAAIADLRDKLGDEKFKINWKRGRTLKLGAAIEYALEESK